MNTIKQLLKSKLAQNGMWLMALQVFNTIIPILTLPYITRILSASVYGEFSIALNWVTYFQVIVEYGFGLNGAKKVATRNSDDDLSYIHSNIIYARIILMLLCFIALIAINFIFPTGKVQIICMLILFLLVVATTFQQTWLFQGLAEMKYITVINMTGRIISVILIFLFVKKPEDLYLYCFLYVSAQLITSFFGCFIALKKYNVKLKFCKVNLVISELKDGWHLFVSSALATLLNNVGITILGIVAVSETVGIYSAVNKIPFVLTVLFGAISQALYPQSCQAFSNSFNIGLNSIKKYGLPVSTFFAFCGLMIIIFNKPIVKIAFGLDYLSGSLLLIPFVIRIIFGIANNFLGIQTLVASSHQKEYSTAFTISIIITLLLMFVLGYLWDSYGVAYAAMLGEIILTIMLVYYIVKIKQETNRGEQS